MPELTREGKIVFSLLGIFFVVVGGWFFPLAASSVFLFLSFLSLLLLKFTKVKEGTVKIRTKFGSFDGIMLTKSEHTVSPKGDIVEGENERFLSFLGGIHFVGIRGIHGVHRRDFKWLKALPNGKIEEREEAGVDFILAKVDYQYGLVVKKAEDINFLPLNIELILTARVINPEKAVFGVKNWFEAVASRVVPHVREFVSKRDFVAEKTEILPAQVIFNDLKNFRDEVYKDYGVEIRRLEVSRVDPPDEFRKSSLKKWEGQREAEGRSASTVGAIMQMLAQQTGKSMEALQKEFGDDPEVALRKYGAIIRSNKSFIEQQIAADSGALNRFHFHGGKGGQDIIALLGSVLGGSSSSGSRDPRKKRVKDMTREEKREEWKRRTGSP